MTHWPEFSEEDLREVSREMQKHREYKSEFVRAELAGWHLPTFPPTNLSIVALAPERWCVVLCEALR